MWQITAISDVVTGVGVGTWRTPDKSSCDDIILILFVGYVCYKTITGGSSQHSAVMMFDLYVAPSERSHLDAV